MRDGHKYWDKLFTLRNTRTWIGPQNNHVKKWSKILNDNIYQYQVCSMHLLYVDAFSK